MATPALRPHNRSTGGRPARNIYATATTNAVPFALCAVLIALVWVPPIAHFHVRNVNLSPAVAERARVQPSESVFKELRRLHSVAPFWKTDASAIQSADEFLRGRTALPDGRKLQLILALAPGRQEQAPPESQLLLSCLTPVDLLLQAYEASGNRAYFLLAKDIVLASEDWDRRAWMPVGLWWNDHAVAARLQALTDFWGFYRQDQSYNESDAVKIMNMISRSGRRLSDKRFFTAATNHGVMQNISLLELSLAFPSIPESEDYRQLAIQRLNLQLDFYISNEGVILEHSAFYQHFGLRLANVITRILALSDRPVPESWEEKFERAKAFYAQLRRPDGTLPQYGDSFAVPVDGNDLKLDDTRVVEQDKPLQSWGLYPVSGYSVSWSGLQHWPDSDALSQTVVTWSNFPTHAHKHADDMSVLLWTPRQSWTTNTGYWPYSSKLRRAAESWLSSNAPHLENEPFPANSPALLTGEGSQSGTVFLDLERTAPRGTIIRREVIEAQPGRWMILDASSGRSAPIVTSWNMAHDVTVAEAGHGCYKLTGQVANSSLTQCIVAGTPLSTTWLHGSTQPFAGWQVVDESAQPANALFVKQASGSWTLTTFVLGEAQRNTTIAPVIREWRGPEHWSMELSDGYNLTREGHSLRWTTADHIAGNLEISAPPAPVASERRGIEQAYSSAVREYPPFGVSIKTRTKLSSLLAGLLLVTILSLSVARIAFARWHPAASMVVAVCWVCTAIVLVMRFNSIFIP